MTVEAEEFLAHYGVMGMRWGHHKTEGSTAAAPRTKEQKIADRTVKREVRAKKYDVKADLLNTKIKDIQSVEAKNLYTKHVQKNQIKDLTKDRDRALVDAQRKRDGKLSTNQRRVVIGASIVAALVATKITHDQIQSGDFTRNVQRGKAFVNGKGKVDLKDPTTFFKKNADLARSGLSADEINEHIVKGVNPNWGKTGADMNCRRATMTYEMRRRGFDVTATRTTNANGQNALGFYNAISPDKKQLPTGDFGATRYIQKQQAANAVRGPVNYKLLKMMEKAGAGSAAAVRVGDPDDLTSASRNIFDTLAKQVDGARGEIGVEWSSGGGHSMAYEMVKGVPVIFDTQSGKKYASAAEMAGDFAKTGLKIKGAGYTRLDNVDLNTDYLLRWMKSA